MGTTWNYYWYKKEPCECCGHQDSLLYIGKSSEGWVFALMVHPDEGINDLPDWEKKWLEPGSSIVDEYGNHITPSLMRDHITMRTWNEGWDRRTFLGYRDEADFHRKNFSERGPNGLLRASRHLPGVTHGAGTWDLHTSGLSLIGAGE